MNEGTDQAPISPAVTTTVSLGAPAPKKRKLINTTALLQQLVQTLDVPAFLADLEELDAVTQRQCLMRALRDLAGTAVIRLHGSRAARHAIRKLQEAQKSR